MSRQIASPNQSTTPLLSTRDDDSSSSSSPSPSNAHPKSPTSPTPFITPNWRRGFVSTRPPLSRTSSALTTSRHFLHRQAQRAQRALAHWSNSRTRGEKIKFVLGWFGTLILTLSVLALYGEFFPVLVTWAKKLGEWRFGWALLWLAIVISALPPAIGYSTLVTLSGLVYGIGAGWLLASSATVVGSGVAFLFSRHVYGDWVRRRTAGDKRFAAFSLVLKTDGIKLLAMIRLCPLPYSMSNGLCAVVPTVSWGGFVAATAIVTPKLFSGVFIGSRLAAVGKGKGDGSDENTGMSTGETVLNYFSIAITFGIACGVAWYVYRRTMARARQLEALEQEPRGERERDWDGSYVDEFDELDEYGIGPEEDARELQVDMENDASLARFGGYRDE